ncbi:MAG TPA: helix-turn-helix transcriptional regulator [Verrucomicrobiae bacterium]|nr:helix-turn-helix transcriptional regulator [Verrucomicrobiae bacterium]
MASRKLTKYIGDRLQEIRSKRNLTQAEVAKQAGTKTNYYSKLERGVVVPSLTLLERIIEVLDVRFKDILP